MFVFFLFQLGNVFDGSIVWKKTGPLYLERKVNDFSFAIDYQQA